MYELTWQNTILFQCVEDESYETIVDAGRDPSTLLGPRGCGNFTNAYVFFTIFYILVSQVYFNLVIAIIVDAFTGASSLKIVTIDQQMVNAFVEMWSKYDPDATYFISIA